MIKWVLDRRWNAVDIAFLPTIVNALLSGEWLRVAFWLACTAPLSIALEVYGKRNWGWQ